MGKTIKLTESELVQLIEDTARKQILLNAKSKDINFDNKVNKVTKHLTKVISKISESSSPNEKIEVIRKETINLRGAGYSYLVIGESLNLCFNTLNEDLSDWIKTAFSGAGDTVKEYAYGWILDLFGIPDGHFKNALVISLAEVGMSDMPRLLTDCKFTSGIVAHGIVEYIMQLIINDVSPGGEGGIAGGAGVLGKVIRNTLDKQLKTTAVHKDLMTTVQNLICDSGNKIKDIETIMGDSVKLATGVTPWAGATSSSAQPGSLMSNFS